MLGQLLFLLYTAELAARYGVKLHSFTNDNQLYIHCRTDDVHLSVLSIERWCSGGDNLTAVFMY